MASPETISSAKKTLATLEAVCEADGGIGVSALADNVGLTKSTAYKHLATLLECGYVERTQGQYELSIRCSDLGEHAKGTDALAHRVHEYVAELVTSTGESAGFVLKHGPVAVDVHHRGSGPLGNSLNTRYLHASAPGKAILSTLSENEVASIVDDAGLQPLTDNTITSLESLEAELSRIRDRGIAFDRREQFEAVHAVAVPVDTDARVGALYVAGKAERLSSKRLEEDVPGVLIGTVRRLKDDLAT